jgi:hypothetical protein
MAGSSFFTPQGILDFLGFGTAPPLVTLANEPPGWFKRLRPAAYKSPTGTTIKFQYVDVSREYELRGTAFEFPQVNDAYVQRKGFGPRKYPLLCYFSGPNSDLVATAFEAALLAPGMGVLDHPRYGKISNVVPFGTVQRTDALGTAANQVIVSVTFWTTTGAVYPNADPATQNEILLGLGNFDVEAAQRFAANAKLNKAALRAGMIATIKGLLKTISGAMAAVSGAVANVRREMQEIEDAINFGIDTLIGQPLLLAQQVSNLIKAPARALAGIESRLDGYARMLEDIGLSSQALPGETLASGTALLDRRDAIGNDFHASDFCQLTGVSGSILASIAKPASGAPATFKTRNQAIAAADEIARQFDQAVALRDAGFGALGGIGEVDATRVDTGESIQALQAVTALAIGYLVQQSFGLKPEQRIILDRDRTIIDLSAELHGKVDEKLDQIIDSNDLSGDEILELPKGKSIGYFLDT